METSIAETTSVNAPGLTIGVQLNGEAQRLPVSTVAELLTARGLAGRRVAVERNGQIVPRGLHGQTLLADGDRLEIVVAVGGG